MTRTAIAAIAAGVALTIVALLAPAPFGGILVGPMLVGAGCVLPTRRQLADRRRRARRGGYLL